MARKKAAYYTLVNHLVNTGTDKKTAQLLANSVYESWIEEGMSQDIIELFIALEENKVEEKSDEVVEPVTNGTIGIKVNLEAEVPKETAKPTEKKVKLTKDVTQDEPKIAYAVEHQPLAKLDWRQYLDDNPDLICLNKEMAKKWGVTDSESITKKKEREVLATLKDDKLKIVLLQFFKDIVHIEGFKSIDYDPLGPSNEFYCGVKCKIDWGNGQSTSGLGDAHGYNTSSFTKYYTAAIAENRAFIRAVKAYFNISIVGADEIGETPKEGEVVAVNGRVDPSATVAKVSVEAPVGPHVTLKRVVKERLGITEFEEFVKYLRKQYGEAVKSDGKVKSLILEKDAAAWKEYGSWESIDKSKVAELITKIKKIKKP